MQSREAFFFFFAGFFPLQLGSQMQPPPYSNATHGSPSDNLDQSNKINKQFFSLFTLKLLYLNTKFRGKEHAKIWKNIRNFKSLLELSSGLVSSKIFPSKQPSSETKWNHNATSNDTQILFIQISHTITRRHGGNFWMKTARKMQTARANEATFWHACCIFRHR